MNLPGCGSRFVPIQAAATSNTFGLYAFTTPSGVATGSTSPWSAFGNTTTERSVPACWISRRIRCVAAFGACRSEPPSSHNWRGAIDSITGRGS